MKDLCELKIKAAEAYLKEHLSPVTDIDKMIFLAGADWAIGVMGEKIKELDGENEMLNTRNIERSKLNIALEAKCERYEKALREISRNAEQLAKILNSHTAEAIKNTANEALNE